MVCVTPAHLSAKFWTSSPAFETTASSKPLDGFPNEDGVRRFVREEMIQLFSDLPRAIHNTSELSARLGYTLAELGYEFPRYPVPEGETMDSFLRKRTEEGFQNRYVVKRDEELFDRAKRQVQKELALIEKLRLAGYFLIVWDIIRFCREHKILVQGRGSAANSAVCYSL